MDGDSDDEQRLAGVGDNAGFGVPDENPDVDLALDLDEQLETEHGKDRRVWLVKVPKFLLERWQAKKTDNEELGRLRVYHKPLPNGSERIVLLLPPTQAGEEAIPTEYSMTIQNKATKNTYIFSERDDVSIGEAGWEPGKGRLKRGPDGDGSSIPEKRRRPTLTGVVHHECNLTPRVDSESYRAILRQRQAKAVEPKRKIQLLTTEDQELNRLGISGMAAANKKFDSFSRPKDSKTKAESSQKMVRLPRNELLDLLFSAFEQYEYWTMKSLRSHTQQPEGYLKLVLPDIAQLNKRGPYSGHWSLLEQYRSKREAGASGTVPKAEGSGTTGPVAGQASSGVKPEPEEEDVKPNALDDDDDDVEMEAVR